MRFLKTTILLWLVKFTAVMAQSDTTYYNLEGQKIEDRTAAQYFKVITVKKALEIQEEFYISGKKRGYYMYKKVPLVSDEMVVVGFGVPNEKAAKPSENSEAKTSDSTVVEHGSFVQWHENGETKMRGSYFTGKLHGDLETFFQNKKIKRQDNYHLDTLKTGRCFDSLGNEIAHFPFKMQPEYKTGQAALFKFLAVNIKYPRDARERGIQGTVYVQFVIDKDGSVTNIYVKKGVNKELNSESMRVVGLMPKWTEGKLDGENVSVKYTLPIKFKLEYSFKQ